MSDILLINGQHIRFSITFTTPTLSDIYKSFTVTDKLIDGLLFNNTDSVVKINGIIVAGYYFLYDQSSNTVKCIINNIENNTENYIEVILDTTIIDKVKITDVSFNNTAYMYVNGDEYLENTSNVCTVQLKMPSQNELIISPESQRISSSFSEAINIDCNFEFFGISTNTAESYVIQTKIIDGYTFDESATTVTLQDIEQNVQSFVLSNFTPKVTYDYDENTRILIMNIINNSEISSKLININLSMKPIAAPIFNQINNLVIELFYNSINSKIIDIKTSSIILRKPINLIKSCDKYEKKLAANNMIYYTLSFIIPAEDNEMDYISFTVSDYLDKCLAFDLSHSAVLCDNMPLQSLITFPEDKTTGTIDISFRNYYELTGKEISVKLACYIYDISMAPKDNIIYNDAVITPNSNTLLSSTSNKVAIRLRKYDEIQPRNDILASIASIEKSNSFILSGEADTLINSKVIATDEKDLNKIRKSIKRIANTSSMLEHIMYQCLEDAEY